MRTTHRYTSPDRDILTIEEYGDYCVINAEDAADREQTRVFIKNPDRQAAAQALAGSSYRVISTDAEEWRIGYDAGFEAGEKYAQSPRPDRPEPVHSSEVQAAQPDRPEPVDPASVRVGAIVEIEGDDWMVRGEVRNTDEPGTDYPIEISVDTHDRGGIWPCTPGNTVRVLQRAEPEVDEAAVEALASALHLADEAIGGRVVDTDTWARELARRGVRVVSTDG